MDDVSYLLLKGNGPLLLLPSFLFKECSLFGFFFLIIVLPSLLSWKMIV